uniref:Minor structural protein n=2 Tax=Rhesus macaque recovirus TaxID=875071 RepID=A0A067YND0_9CALI|nr:minor structural protein [Rhesus macaque recovirus]
MAGAAFASGLGQAAGGIFGSLISGAIQAGLNEQQFNHNKQLAEQQHGYNLELAKQQGEIAKDLSSYNQQLDLSKYLNAGFSASDAALLSKNSSSAILPTRVLTHAGVKTYAANNPTGYLTSGMQLSSGIKTMYNAAKTSKSKSTPPTVYNWVNNPLNFDTLSINSSAGLSRRPSTASTSSSLSTMSSNSLSRYSTWGSYMDYKAPLD